MGVTGMPGTMDMRPWSFMVMWTLMMAAMMLSSMAPLALLYERTVKENRSLRLVSFGFGYIGGWGATGFVAYVMADQFGSVSASRPLLAQAMAILCFVGAGLYQFTPLKMRCLKHCRSPIGHLMRYVGFSGWSRDFRAGCHHSLFCLGCCWAIMVLMVAFGVMNLIAMVGLSLLIAIEKHWKFGEQFSKSVGLLSLAWGVLIIFDPSFAPGLDPDQLKNMGDMGS